MGYMLRKAQISPIVELCHATTLKMASAGGLLADHWIQKEQSCFSATALVPYCPTTTHILYLKIWKSITFYEDILKIRNNFYSFRVRVFAYLHLWRLLNTFPMKETFARYT